MSLCDASTKPFWRKVHIEHARHEAALLSDESELLYYRFLLAYIEHRCVLPSDAQVLAKVLNTSAKKADQFVKDCRKFLSVDADGNLVHQSSVDDFNESLRVSLQRTAAINKRWGKSE